MCEGKCNGVCDNRVVGTHYFDNVEVRGSLKVNGKVVVDADNDIDPDIKPGDVVVLRSGSREMTVVAKYDSGLVDVVYQGPGDDFCFNSVIKHALVKINK